MRVLWVFEHLAIQGQLQQVASQLASHADVSLEVMTRWTGEPPVDPHLIPLTRLDCRRKLDFAARRIIREKIEATPFDIVHAYSSRDLANLLGASRGRGSAPKLVGYRGTVSRLRWLDPANWITFWHPRLTKIVCVSHATARALLASGVPQSKLVPIWEGCAPESLGTPPRSARREFGIPEDAFVVGLVANMRPVKGVDLLLRAAVELTDLPDVYWLLVGDIRDPRIPSLAADPRIADRVRLIGHQPNGGRFAGLFDIYVSPSRMEGFGLSVMEAMAQGVCPVVTSVGGSPELVRHEIDGLIVPPEDPSSLAEAIRRLHGSVAWRKSLAASAAQRVREEFSITQWTDRLHQAYRRLLADSEPASPARRAA